VGWAAELLLVAAALVVSLIIWSLIKRRRGGKGD
jgi:hypothetical protein